MCEHISPLPMTQIPRSNGKLYITPISEHLDIRSDVGFYMIYAPENGKAVILDAASATALLEEDSTAQLLKEELLQQKQEEATGGDTQEKHLELLPTMSCNFRCSYCYAAKAHSHEHLSREQCDQIIRTFISSQDKSNTTYKISFVGGGEPILEWENICYCMKLASTRANARGCNVRFSIISNGSLIDKDKYQTLKEFDVAVRVSFEILPDIQQKQRGAYARVAQNITGMCAAGVRVGIRSIITENNVHRQNEMIQYAAAQFPKIKSLDFEPVCTSAESPHSLRTFYQKFTDAFFEARETAKAKGIRLDCIALRMAQGRGEFFCPGDFCVSPSGVISACHRSVTPNDRGYETFVYGKLFSNGEMQINAAAFQQIQHRKTAESYEECRQCFARKNCAGGCLYQRLLLREEQFRIHCEFTRNFLLRYLLNIQDEACRKQHGKTLREFLSSQHS